jgi:hypothetical protein
MLFEVTGNGYQDINGRNYKRGEHVESHVDLTKKFKNGFKRVIVAAAPTAVAETEAGQASSSPTESEAGNAASGSGDPEINKPTGKDVTFLFPAAKGKDMFVHKEGDFFIAVNGTGKLLTPDPITKDLMTMFVANNA